MLTVGQILKRAREQSKKTIDEVAHATKIKLEYLTNIESNKFTGFVSSTFIKGFIRSYANFLDLDAENLVALYRRQVGEEEKPIKSNLKKVSTDGFVLSPVHLISGGLAVFFVVIIGFLIIQFYRLQQPPQLEIVTPKEATFDTDKNSLEIIGATEEQSIVTINGAQIQLKPDKTFTYVAELKSGENVFRIESWKEHLENKKTTKTIIAKLVKPGETTSQPSPGATNAPQTTEETEFTVKSTAEAWVQIVADNVQQAVGVVPNNYNKNFKTKNEFYVVTGKPNATKLILEGKERTWAIRNGVGSLTCTRGAAEWSCK